MPAFAIQSGLLGLSSRNWPEQLIIVRHGQSAGNIVKDAAHEAVIDRIALDLRDAEVPQSDPGAEQVRAPGDWFSRLHSSISLRFSYSAPVSGLSDSQSILGTWVALMQAAKSASMNDCEKTNLAYWMVLPRQALSTFSSISFSPTGTDYVVVVAIRLAFREQTLPF